MRTISVLHLDDGKCWPLLVILIPALIDECCHFVSICFKNAAEWWSLAICYANDSPMPTVRLWKAVIQITHCFSRVASSQRITEKENTSTLRP